jgi:hypothetical protein
MMPRFTFDNLCAANDSWGCNCGPGSVAAILGLTLDEVRQQFTAAGFDAKRYTNPTMMFEVLKASGRSWTWSSVRVADKRPAWPRYGLARIQWEGPWTQPGVPIRARYRQTHWVGVATKSTGDVGVFDINALGNGSGWCALADWSSVLVPFILADVKRASGGWHITHAIEVSR